MPKLLFEFGLDEREQEEADARGYLSHVKVELDDGSQYAVYFYDHVRLGQDLEEEIKSGNGFIAEPGMIVLNEVKLDKMQAAVDRLEIENFFDSLIPL